MLKIRRAPLVTHLAPSFRFTEEFYQFRAFSRDQVRVLLTLDTQSVNMTAAGINRTDGDFALAWIRNYGKGRVFYSAFGHFPGSFQLPPIRTMLLKALLWLTGEIDADATPRSGPIGAVTFDRCRWRAGSLRRQRCVRTRQHRHHRRRQAHQRILLRGGRGRASVATGGNACGGEWHRCAPVLRQARPSARRTPYLPRSGPAGVAHRLQRESHEPACSTEHCTPRLPPSWPRSGRPAPSCCT